MKTALVTGGGGFIGHHLIHYPKKKGYLVRGVDLKYPKWSKTEANEFYIFDLREFVGRGLDHGSKACYHLFR